MGILSERYVWELLSLLKESDEVRTAVRGSAGPAGVSAEHVKMAKLGGAGDEVRPAVIGKAASERLSASQTRAVAESVAAAPTKEARERLIREPYSPTLHDPEMIRSRTKEYGAADPMWRTPVSLRDTASVAESPEARAILDMVKRWRDQRRSAQQAIEAGKLSPEACRFLAGRVSKFASELAAWADELEGVAQ